MGAITFALWGQVLFTNGAAKSVPPLSKGEIVFTGEAIPAEVHGVSVYQPKGVSVSATPIK